MNSLRAWACALGLAAGSSSLAQSPGFVLYNPTNNAVVDPDGFWVSNRLSILASLSLDSVINGGVPNSGSALIDWSQLRNVPAGFADGSDDGAGGGSGTVTSVGLTAPLFLLVSGSPVTTSGTISLSWSNQVANTVLAGPTTGVDAAPTFRSLVDADLPSGIARDSEVAAAYQPLDADLTQLATLNGSALTNLNGTEIRSGTVAAARIDSAMATDAEVSAGYQPLDADLSTLATLNGSALTNLNGTEIRSGTIAAARIDSAIATDAEVSAAYQPLDADLTDLADGSLTGSKVGTGVDAANVTTGTLGVDRLNTNLTQIARALPTSGQLLIRDPSGVMTNIASTGSGSVVRSSTPTIETPLLSGAILTNAIETPLSAATRYGPNLTNVIWDFSKPRVYLLMTTNSWLEVFTNGPPSLRSRHSALTVKNLSGSSWTLGIRAGGGGTNLSRLGTVATNGIVVANGKVLEIQAVWDLESGVLTNIVFGAAIDQ